MAKNDIMSDTVTAETEMDDFVLDMLDDDDGDDFSMGERTAPRRNKTAHGMLMATVAVVAVAGAGLGYLATAGAEQLDRVGGKIVTELTAIDARDVDPGFPVQLSDAELARAPAMPTPVDGVPVDGAPVDLAFDQVVDKLVVIEPASGLGSAPAPAPAPMPAPAPAPAAGASDISIAPPPADVSDAIAAAPPAPEPTIEVVEEVPPAIEEPAPAPIILSNDDPVAPPMPDLSGLEGASDPMSGVGSMPVGREAASGSSQSRVVAPPTQETDADVYYDSTPGVPSGPLSNTVGPRKVDPNMEPASRMVIVQKDHGAGDEESRVIAAGRALELGRYDAALEMYDLLYAKNKRDVRILMGRAVAQQNSGFNELAIQSYEEVLNVDPHNTNAVINMMGLLQQEYPSVALRRLMDLREKHPGNAGLMAQIGMTYATMGQTQDAVRALGAAASLDTHNATHLYNLAVLFDRSGDAGNALKYYEQALETDAVYGEGRSIPRDQVYDRLSKLRSH